MLSKLFALGKEQLQPQTDPEKRLARSNRCVDRLDQVVLLEIGHAVAKGSDAREYNMARVSNDLGIARDHGLMPYRLKGFGDAAQIPHPVINNGDHDDQVLGRAVTIPQSGSRLPLGPTNNKRDRPPAAVPLEPFGLSNADRIYSMPLVDSTFPASRSSNIVA